RSNGFLHPPERSLGGSEFEPSARIPGRAERTRSAGGSLARPTLPGGLGPVGPPTVKPREGEVRKALGIQYLETARPPQLGRVGIRAFSENSGEGRAPTFGWWFVCSVGSPRRPRAGRPSHGKAAGG